MATISNLTVSSSGVVSLTNPGTQVNPVLSWTARSGAVVPNSYVIQSPSVTSYQMAAGFKTGDQAQIQRIKVTTKGVATSGGVFTATVPPGTTPQPVTRITDCSVSGTFQSGKTLTATSGTYKNATSVTHAWLRGTVAEQGEVDEQITVGTGLTYTLTSADVGNEISFQETAIGVTGPSLTEYIWGTTTVVAAPPSGPPSLLTEPIVS